MAHRWQMQCGSMYSIACRTSRIIPGNTAVCAITKLEKRTAGSMDASRTAQIAPVCAREAGTESGLGRAARSGRDQAEPEGFKCIHVCWLSANFAIRTETFHSRCRHLGYLISEFPFQSFLEVHQGRWLQMQTCPSFFDSISRRIKRRANKYCMEGKKQMPRRHTFFL